MDGSTTNPQGVSSPSDRSKAAANALLLGDVIAGPVFVAVFMIEGAMSTGYDSVRLPVSLVSTGEDGWRQVVNFIVDGLLLLGFAIGLYRAFGQRGTPAELGPLLLRVFALGVIGAGVFGTDPGAGSRRACVRPSNRQPIRGCTMPCRWWCSSASRSHAPRPALRRFLRKGPADCLNQAGSYSCTAQSSMPSVAIGATIALSSEAGLAGPLATLESKTC